MFRKLLNPDQSQSSILEMLKSDSGCCGSSNNLVKCQYTSASITWADVVTNGGIVSITVNDEGVAKVITLASPVTSVADLKQSIIDAFATIGYVMDEEPLDIKVTGTTTVVVDIWGELVVTSMTDGTATYNFTQKCTKKVISDYKASYGEFSGNDIVLSVDGSTDTLNGPFAISGAGATALQSAIESSMTGEQSVDVTHNAVDGTLDVTIVYDKGTEILLDGTELIESNVRAIYTA